MRRYNLTATRPGQLIGVGYQTLPEALKACFSYHRRGYRVTLTSRWVRVG